MIRAQDAKPWLANQICLARQPILDRRGNVVAYELLFRAPGETVASFENAYTATVNVVTNAFTNIGAETMLGGKKAYINFDANMLSCDITSLLPRDKVVVEISGAVNMDAKLLTTLRSLHGEGFRFALGNFVYSKELEPLFQFVDTIKLDITRLSKEELVEQAEYFINLKKNLLAEKVDNHNDFEMCLSLGCKLFQGYFFAKPTIVTQGELPASKRQLIEVMNAVMEDADSRVLEEKIIRDVSVSYKLLKFVNSAGLSRGQPLNTINDALTMLGRKQLYRWLSILLFSAEDDQNKQPGALFNAAIYRGRLMEILGEMSRHKNPAELFVLGSFSYLDALLNRKLAWIIKDMLVPEPIKDALLKNEGQYWSYLELVMALDKGKFDDALIARAGLSIDKINEAQLQATAYCEMIT